jgi:hypothetical protein
LEAIAGAFGDTTDGLTGSEIGHLLATRQIADTFPGLTKRHRLFNALAHDQSARGDRTRILGFIRSTQVERPIAVDEPGTTMRERNLMTSVLIRTAHLRNLEASSAHIRTLLRLAKSHGCHG